MAFLTLAGDEYLVRNFRQSADEVSPSGVVAQSWQAEVFCSTDAEAATLRALQSHNLRRTIGWQLRGSGHGDVTMDGDVVSPAATVRLTVESDEYGHAEEGSAWYRVLSLLIREQVA